MQGSNGGITKPKFFFLHSMIDSTVTGINIKNTPVQCFSINDASNLKVTDVTIDNSAGDAGGMPFPPLPSPSFPPLSRLLSPANLHSHQADTTRTPSTWAAATR